MCFLVHHKLQMLVDAHINILSVSKLRKGILSIFFQNDKSVCICVHNQIFLFHIFWSILLYWLLNMILNGIAPDTCDHISVNFDICLSTMLTFHRLFLFFIFHTDRQHQLPHNIYKVHSGTVVNICVHRALSYYKDCHILVLQFHI